jgi:hypothetical protein
MKKSKIDYRLIASVMLLLVFITAFAWEEWIEETAGSGEKSPIRIETLSGSSEFYFIPAGDNRIWHVVNKYNSPDLKTEYNLSDYRFSADSVSVVNEIAYTGEYSNFLENINY